MVTYNVSQEKLNNVKKNVLKWFFIVYCFLIIVTSVILISKEGFNVEFVVDIIFTIIAGFIASIPGIVLFVFMTKKKYKSYTIEEYDDKLIVNNIFTYEIYFNDVKNIKKTRFNIFVSTSNAIVPIPKVIENVDDLINRMEKYKTKS